MQLYVVTFTGVFQGAQLDGSIQLSIPANDRADANRKFLGIMQEYLERADEVCQVLVIESIEPSNSN